MTAVSNLMVGWGNVVAGNEAVVLKDSGRLSRHYLQTRVEKDTVCAIARELVGMA
jgi:hypothetical protein